MSTCLSCGRLVDGTVTDTECPACRAGRLAANVRSTKGPQLCMTVDEANATLRDFIARNKADPETRGQWPEVLAWTVMLAYHQGKDTAEARIAELEAALRDIADSSCAEDHAGYACPCCEYDQEAVRAALAGKGGA